MIPGGDATTGNEQRTVLVTARAPSRGHLPPRALVLTGTRSAAVSLAVPHLSPAAYAARVLREDGRRVAGRLARWRALGDAVGEVLPGDDPAGVRRTLAGPVAELLRSGLRAVPEGVAVSCRTVDALRVAVRYRELLAGRGTVDPSASFLEAEELVRRHGARARLAVAGAWGLSEDVVAFVDAVAAPGSLVVLGPERRGVAASFAARGWTVHQDASAPRRIGERLAARLSASDAVDVPPPGATAYGFPSPEAEARWILARAKNLLRDGVPPGHVTIATRSDAADWDLLEAVAWELDVPLAAARPVPLHETRLGGWLAAACEAVRRGLPYEETLRVLGSGIVGGMPDDVYAAARSRRPAGAAAWRATDPRAGALAWPREDRAEGWSERLEATLAAFGLADEGALAPADAAVLRTVRQGLAVVCRPGDRRLVAGEFLRELTDLLGLLQVRRHPRPEPTHDAVRLAPLSALAGGALPYLFVVDAAEGSLPAALRDPPVLDFADRASLAAAGVPLPTAREWARDEEALVAAALRAVTKEVIFTVAAGAGGAARLPSPFLERLGLRLEPAPTLPPASVEERRRRLLQTAAPPDDPDPVRTSAREAWRVEVRRESDAAPDAHDGVTGVTHDPDRTILSASQIVELGNCPFRWFVHRSLGVREPEEVDEGVPPSVRGELWHHALDRAVRAGVRAAGPDADGGAIREAVAAALPAAFAEAEQVVGVPAAPAWAKARAAEIRTLLRAVRSADFLSPGAVPVAFERTFEGLWRGLRVRGRVDRVDAGPGGLELVDYKSGTRAPAGAKGEDGWSRVDVQLPLYLEAGRDVVAGGELSTARYLSLRSGETVGTARPGGDAPALDLVAQRVRGALEHGSFPVQPDPRRSVCTTCDLRLVCRVGARVDRKRTAPEPESAPAAAR